MSIKLINTNIEIAFSSYQDSNYNTFKQEFDKLSDIEQDPLQQWVKLAKARGDTKDSDNILLQLVIELHRKIDNIEKQLHNKKDSYLPLAYHNEIIAVGHEYFTLNNNTVSKSHRFYGRITMPIFPKRIVPLFFSFYSGNIYKIELMHEKDISDYDAYIVARERALIREKRKL